MEVSSWSSRWPWSWLYEVWMGGYVVRWIGKYVGVGVGVAEGGGKVESRGGGEGGEGEGEGFKWKRCNQMKRERKTRCYKNKKESAECLVFG